MPWSYSTHRTLRTCQRQFAFGHIVASAVAKDPQLVGQVARITRAPVALLGHGQEHRLALPADVTLPSEEVHLTPHVAQLSAWGDSNVLSPRDQSDEARDIRAEFVAYALRSVLMRDRRLWGRGQRWSKKHPTNASRSADVDLYPSFSWSIETLGDGRLFLAVVLTTRYVARQWLDAYVTTGNEAEYRAQPILWLPSYARVISISTSFSRTSSRSPSSHSQLLTNAFACQSLSSSRMICYARSLRPWMSTRQRTTLTTLTISRGMAQDVLRLHRAGR